MTQHRAASKKVFVYLSCFAYHKMLRLFPKSKVVEIPGPEAYHKKYAQRRRLRLRRLTLVNRVPKLRFEQVSFLLLPCFFFCQQFLNTQYNNNEITVSEDWDCSRFFTNKNHNKFALKFWNCEKSSDVWFLVYKKAFVVIFANETSTGKSCFTWNHPQLKK